MKIEAFFILSASILAIMVVQSNFVNADIYGYVNITILASPPSIAGIRIAPEPAYQDSVLNCEVEIWGNNPSDYKLNYRWYVNDELRSNEKQFEAFKVGNKVTCEVTAYDSLNRGEIKRNSTVIMPRSSAVTGYIVNNLSSVSGSSKGALIFGLMITLVFLIAWMR